MYYIVFLLINFVCHLKAIVDAYKEEPGNTKYAFKVFSFSCFKITELFLSLQVLLHCLSAVFLGFDYENLFGKPIFRQYTCPI